MMAMPSSSPPRTAASDDRSASTGAKKLSTSIFQGWLLFRSASSPAATADFGIGPRKAVFKYARSAGMSKSARAEGKFMVRTYWSPSAVLFPLRLSYTANTIRGIGERTPTRGKSHDSVHVLRHPRRARLRARGNEEHRRRRRRLQHQIRRADRLRRWARRAVIGHDDRWDRCRGRRHRWAVRRDQGAARWVLDPRAPRP